ARADRGRWAATLRSREPRREADLPSTASPCRRRAGCGKGLAPVALARKEPVAQAIADRALAQAALLQPRDDFLLRVRHVEPVEECAVHVRAVAEVSLALDIPTRHDFHDRQAELLRERPVTLVVGGAREHGAG